MTIGGYDLPAGVVAVPNIYLVHRNPRVWPQPHRFDPQRFVDDKPTPYTFFPFGGGIHKCIGLRFSPLEVKTILAHLLRRYHWTLVKPGYRIRYNKGGLILADPSLDWSENFAHMLGIDDPKFYDLMRLYMVLHSDHEGGNVSAFTAHVVASALSDPYYAVSAGLSGLAGPLHGLANQECLKFVLGVMDRFEGAPTPGQMEEYTWEVLNSGRVIPGYGHAVLRATDPRFTSFHAFGELNFPDDPVFKTVDVGFQVIPKVLQEQGKAASPWPNVDAGSGALLHHFGITEMRYYTVLFSVSRAMGICAQLVTSRAMLEPITRPKSVSTAWMKERVGMKETVGA